MSTVNSKPLSEISRATLLILSVLLFGTLGYHLIQGWSLFDSLYMTTITLATVGYSEVGPLSPEGKTFTIILIMTGVTLAAYCFTVITRIVVDGELRQISESRRMQQRISSFKNHIIVCGAGRLGTIVVRELVEAKQDVVVVDNNSQALEVVRQLGVPTVEGSAYEDEVLMQAGIDRAKTLLALLPNDADNVYVTLSARDLSEKLYIIARTEGGAGEKRLERAGATQVLAPYRITGSNLVHQLVQPNVSEFLKLVYSKSGNRLVLEEIQVPEDSALAGKTLEEAQLPAATGAMVAAIIEDSGTLSFNPGGKSVIKGGSKLIVLGRPDSLAKLASLL